ncbi:MAG TPA: hypothetical protein QGF05_13605, partial [Dehalococcoidia bacterium]|nr:hypothetical protein [Dehalococcoidia bacterium]
ALCVESGAMAMFSVHPDSLPSGGNGLTTLFRDPGFGQKDADRAIAEVVHAAMWDVLQPGKRSRGFVDFGLFRGNWGVARGAIGIPTVILEPVVISDPPEALRLAPSVTQAGARRLQIVEAEIAAIVAARAPSVVACKEDHDEQIRGASPDPRPGFGRGGYPGWGCCNDSGSVLTATRQRSRATSRRGFQYLRERQYVRVELR